MEFATLQRYCKKTSAEVEIQNHMHGKEHLFLGTSFQKKQSSEKGSRNQLQIKAERIFKLQTQVLDLACATNAVPKNK